MNKIKLTLSVCVLTMFLMLLSSGNALYAKKSGIFKNIHNSAVSSPAPAPAAEEPVQPVKPAEAPKPPTPKHSVDINKEIERLDSKKAKDRTEAIDSLGKAKAKEAEPKLIEKLGNEKDEAVKIHVINSLGSTGGAESVKKLTTAVKEDSSPDIRAASCMSLGALQDKNSVKTLKEVMSNESEKENVRVCAGASLIIYFIEEPGVKTAIENVLTGSKVRPVRFGLVDNLKHVSGKTESKYLLGVAQNDKDAEIKALATEILKENEKK
jgi:hypothetical protein